MALPLNVGSFKLMTAVILNFYFLRMDSNPEAFSQVYIWLQLGFYLKRELRKLFMKKLNGLNLSTILIHH